MDFTMDFTRQPSQQLSRASSPTSSYTSSSTISHKTGDAYYVLLNGGLERGRLDIQARHLTATMSGEAARTPKAAGEVERVLGLGPG